MRFASNTDSKGAAAIHGTQYNMIYMRHTTNTNIILWDRENTVRFYILRPPLLFFNVPKTIRECLRGRGRFLMLWKNCPKQPLALQRYSLHGGTTTAYFTAVRPTL